MDVERYHLVLSFGDTVSMQGWWAVEKTARRKFSAWVGERGDMPGVRIVLIDEQAGELLEAWPKPA